MPKENVQTKVIDNFGGRMTRINYGDLNSGFTKYNQTFGNDPFNKPGQLTWTENAVQIDPSGSVITDLIMDGESRVESGVSYVYAIGHTGRLYKIQVNDPASFDPNYDNPVLLTTLTSGSPTFTRGASIDFFGATERIYIGHDKGVTRVDFDGTNETVVTGTWTQMVPRPLKQFIGKLYVGNGSNIAEIDSTGTVASSTKLSPGFPDNTQVRDMDQTSDGNYLQMVVTRLALPDITATTQDTTFQANSESFVFKWNGIDTGYTSFDSYPSFSLNANIMFGDYQYVFGYDLVGACVFNPTEKILTSLFEQSPLPNAIGSNGNIVGFATTFFFQGFQDMCLSLYGSLDKDVPVGLWSQFGMGATGTETDIVRIPFAQLVSNFFLGSVTSGYAGGIVGTAKYYFSTLETSPAPTTKYKLYKFYNVSLGFSSTIEGVYETQNEMFSKRMKVNEIRIYAEPWIANNSFQIDLIGADLGVITNSTKVFATSDSTLTVGEDYAWYNPAIQPTYCLGIRITNLGTTNHTINKIEVDLSEAGE